MRKILPYLFLCFAFIVSIATNAKSNSPIYSGDVSPFATEEKLSLPSQGFFVDPTIVEPTDYVHLYRNGILQNDYATIQEAINVSADGDSIYVDSGTFREQLTIQTGIVIQGAGIGNTIIESPDSSALNEEDWKTLKAQDVLAVIGIKATNSSVQVKIKGVTVDGRNQGYLSIYGDEMSYTFQGIGVINTNLLVEDVNITRVRSLASFGGSVVPAGYEPEDQPSGMNHNEAIFAESADGAGEHTLEVNNTYIDKFQKTAILAWGPTLTVNIHDNTIQGYGKTLWSTGNGIQIASSDRSSLGGANGDRRGTTGVIKDNQILDIGLVIPEPGQDSSYLNVEMYSPSSVLLWEAGDGFEISGNTITRSDITKSWHVDATSADGGFGSVGVDIVSSIGTVVKDNTISGFDEAVSIEEYLSAPSLVLSNNTVSENTIDYGMFSGVNNLSLSASNELLAYYTSSQGDDTISNFTFGDTIQIIDLATGVVNALLDEDPSIDYSNGAITSGDGTNVAALSMQVLSGDTTYLYIDTDETADEAELKLILIGKYLPGNFYFSGPYIIYQYTLPEVTTTAISTYDATTATMGGNVIFDGGTSISERGVVYSSENKVPTIGEVDVVKDTIELGTGIGIFSESVDSLMPGVTYYVQAYAINLADSVGYGGVDSFTTDCNLEASILADSMVTCYGESDGGATVVPTGGTEPYSYIWSNSATTASITGVAAGTYYVDVTDINGCFASDTVLITTADSTAPTFDVKDITVQLDSSGNAFVTGDDLVDNAWDNCMIADTVISLLSGVQSVVNNGIPDSVGDTCFFDCSQLGENKVVVRLIDSNGNSTVDTALVTVEDTLAPVLELQNITAQLDENGSVSITVSDLISEATDNCSLADTLLSKNMFDCSEIGGNQVTVTLYDGEGNFTVKTATVTVADTLAPVLSAKGIEVFLDANGEYELTEDDIAEMTEGTTDNCSSLDEIKFYANPSSFSCGHVHPGISGVPVVRIEALDKNGNSSKAWISITVSDSITPVFAAVEDVELEIDPCDTVTTIDYPSISATDNCSFEIKQIAGLGENGIFPIGTTTETWVVTDIAGNTDTLSFNVVVVGGNAQPTLDPIADVTVDEDAGPVVVELSGISAGEDCETQYLTVSVASLDQILINSLDVNYVSADSTAELEIALAANKSGATEISVTVKDDEGATISQSFTLYVTAKNDAPFLVDSIPDQSIYSGYAIEIPLSSVLGVLFDDVDDDELVLSAMIEGADSLPTWAVFANDTLFCEPTAADTGCVNIVVMATDTSGATAADTFEVCVENLATGVGNISMQELEVEMYPNPTSGLVNINISSGVHDVVLSVMDIAGRVVLQEKYSAMDNITFNMNGKVPGMYFVQMDVDGERIVKKLIVNNN